MTTQEQISANQGSQFRIGAIVAAIAAIIAVISSLLTLYSQAATVINDTVGVRLRQDFAPVGTIIASFLNESEFAEAIGENVGDGFDKRKWILADGSTVRDTEFARMTGNKPVPDLRGMFLRGVTGSRVAGSLENYATALPASPFTGTTSEVGDHQHGGGMRLNTNGEKYEAGGNDYQVANGANTAPAGAHSHTVIFGGGDAETRPVNVAVFYYIKIN